MVHSTSIRVRKDRRDRERREFNDGDDSEFDVNGDSVELDFDHNVHLGREVGDYIDLDVDMDTDIDVERELARGSHS